MFWSVGNALALEPPAYGPEIETIVLTSFCGGAATGAVAKRSVRFDAKQRKLTVRWISETLDAETVSGTHLKNITVPIYQAVFDDTIGALRHALAPGRKPVSFDREPFFAHLAAERARTFCSDEALRAYLRHASAVRDERHTAKSPEERLNEDAEGFHPKARGILDDPRDWSCDDEFSPHGNDAGADILNNWPAFRKMSLAQAGRAMEFPPLSDDLEDHLWKEWVDTALGLAFGHVKKSGQCPARIAAATRDLLAREFARNKARVAWEHRQEWERRLARYDRKLYPFDTR